MKYGFLSPSKLPTNEALLPVVKTIIPPGFRSRAINSKTSEGRSTCSITSIRDITSKVHDSISDKYLKWQLLLDLTL
jgi:hypothetical protein